jgi:hypothetical protein
MDWPTATIGAGNGESLETAPYCDRHGPMRYRITKESGYISADLHNRRTAGETAAFLKAVTDECLKHGCYRVLVSVHQSRPIFAVEKYGFSAFVELTLKYPARVAVTADTAETRLAIEYATMLARLRGINARAFRDDGTAIAWLERGR